jgi:aspartate--ammonia ligase
MKSSKPYRSKLDLLETEIGIKLIKDTFEHELASELNLTRVSAPRFLETGNGLQDDLAGTQEPVAFRVKHTDNAVEMVQSLAKWKRMALARYGFQPGEGLYTDMDAVRKDEVVDDIHSNYVDQWDWEVAIRREDRNIDFLKQIVRRIYTATRHTQSMVCERFSGLERFLPDEIRFLHCQDLEDEYPDLAPPERENRAAEKYGAFFLIGVGARLRSGKIHDSRAADYDDWHTETEPGRRGLNGDIVVFDQVRGKALELSSMGIRVDEVSLLAQLRLMGQEERKALEFHSGVLNGSIPLSIGGGIGQSRLCMLLLQKRHIAEVQVSVWPQDMIREFQAQGVFFL